MKRFTGILTGFLLALFIIAGCGGGGTSGSGGASGGNTSTAGNDGVIATEPAGSSLKVWVYANTAGAKAALPLEGAVVTIVGTDKQAVTNINGYAQIQDIVPGDYYITVTKEGYDGYSQTVNISADSVSTVGSGAAPVCINSSTVPAISNIIPLKANVNEEITITGVNFGTELGKVEFCDSSVNPNRKENLEILSWDNKEIKCKMVPGVAEGNISVYNKDELKSRETLNAKAGPSLDVINDTTQGTANSGSIGDTAVIYGSGFGISKTAAAVTFNGISATVTSCNPYNIVCTVPAGAATGSVIVTISGSSTSGLTFTVNGGWTPAVSRGI